MLNALGQNKVGRDTRPTEDHFDARIADLPAEIAVRLRAVENDRQTFAGSLRPSTEQFAQLCAADGLLRVGITTREEQVVTVDQDGHNSLLVQAYDRIGRRQIQNRFRKEKYLRVLACRSALA